MSHVLPSCDIDCQRTAVLAAEGRKTVDPYDSAAVQAVWQRVLQVREPCEEATPESELAEMISDELTDQAVYLAIARCAGRFAPVFRAIAHEEACHARRLSALYYLLTGCRSCASRGAVKERWRLCDAVRERYAEELKGAKKYRAAAERWPEHAALFSDLADAEQRHSCRLHAVASEML